MTTKSLVAGIFFTIVLGYAGYQVTGLLRQPKLIIDEPSNGSTLTEKLVVIRGRAIGLSRVSIDREKIDLNENGAIESKLLLAEGYNIIKLEGEDRFGRIIKKNLQLIYRPPSPPTAYGQKK